MHSRTAVLAALALAVLSVLVLAFALRGERASVSLPSSEPEGQEVAGATRITLPDASSDARKPGTVREPRTSLQSEQTRAEAPVVAGGRIHGRVVDESGEPVLGARVTIVQHGRARELHVGSARSDGEGLYSVATTLLEGLSGATLQAVRVGVHVNAKGFYPGVTRASAEAASKGMLRVDVELEAGATWCGQVLDAAGRPVPFAGLLLKVRTGSASDALFVSEADADGRFCLAAKAEAFELEASKQFVGTSVLALDVLDLSLAEDARLPDVVLDPGHVLEGRVVCETGEGIEGLSILARPVVIDSSSFLQSGRTAGDGTFRVVGLQDALYVLSIKGGPSLPNEHRPGDLIEDTRLQGTVLRIRTQDGHGVEMSEFPSVREGALGEDGVFYGSASHSTTATGTPGLRYVIFERESTALLTFDLPDGQMLERFVEPAPEACVEERVFVLEPPPLGRLRIELAAEAGALPVHSLGLISPLSGYELFDIDADEWSAPGIADVPAGLWRVRVVPGDDDGPLAFVPAIEASGTVQVNGGETTTLRLRAPTGGRLRLRVDLVGERDDTAGPPIFPVLRSVDEGDVHSLRFEESNANWLVSGRPGTSKDALPAGTFVLHVRCAGFVAAEQLLTLRAGEIVELSLALERLPEPE